jgi:hypothetical protein
MVLIGSRFDSVLGTFRIKPLGFVNFWYVVGHLRHYHPLGICSLYEIS